MKLGPVTFLFAVVIGWAAIRVMILWPVEARRGTVPRIAWQPALVRSIPSPKPQASPLVEPRARTSFPPRPRQIIGADSGPTEISTVVAPSAAAPPRVLPPPPTLSPIHPPTPPIERGKQERNWRVSAWSIVRDAQRGGSLAAAGQLGGSQAGVRASHDLGRGMSLATRVSGPLGSRGGTEAALALDWRPLGVLPLTVSVERRAGLDAGGRDAFAAGAFGGFQTEMRGFTVDGYAQAGVVGMKRRDAYLDGAVRIERTVVAAGKMRLGAGAGVWGGIQPGVSRLDIGPQLVARLPVGPASLRISAEWRERVAGNALPGSGPALSIGADF